MTEVKVFVASSWKGPRKQDGAAKWLVECVRKDIPETREGILLLANATQMKAELAALTEALRILNRPCRVRIYTECAGISSAVSNGWHMQWQGNGWKNAKGRPVKNAAQWEAFLESAKRHEYTMENAWHKYAGEMKRQASMELEQWKKKREEEAGTQMELKDVCIQEKEG